MHLTAARIAQDATCTEGSGTEFHRTLEPTDHVFFRNQLCHVATEMFVALAGREVCLLGSECAGDLFVRERGPQQGTSLEIVSWWLASVVQQLMPDEEGCPQCATRVTRRRLDPEVFKRSFSQDLAIADAVESDATRQHQVVQTRLPVQMTRHAQHDLFADDLHRGG